MTNRLRRLIEFADEADLEILQGNTGGEAFAVANVGIVDALAIMGFHIAVTVIAFR